MAGPSISPAARLRPPSKTPFSFLSSRLYRPQSTISGVHLTQDLKGTRPRTRYWNEICTCIAGFPTRALIRGWSLGSDPSDGSQSPCPFCLSIRRLNLMIWVLEQSRGWMPRNEISSDRESVYSRWRITKFGGVTLLHAKSRFGGCARTLGILTKSTTSVGIAVVGDNAVTPSE